MKKRITYLVVLATISLFCLASCKATGDCPAYSQIEVEAADNNA